MICIYVEMMCRWLTGRCSESVARVCGAPSISDSRSPCGPKAGRPPPAPRRGPEVDDGVVILEQECPALSSPRRRPDYSSPCFWDSPLEPTSIQEGA
jgi:hypothetical protein